jgi:cytochrome c-type biogenesis protein CcmF
MGGALMLFAARAGAMEAKGLFAPVSRESALVANNLLLAVSCFVVFVGTIWPLVAELLWDRKLSVGEPFFNAAFTPFMVVIALLMPLGAILSWKRAVLGRPLRAMLPVAVLAVALGLLAYAMQTGRSALGPVGLGLGAWVVFGAGLDLWLRSGRGSVGQRLGRMLRLPRADWGKATAHAGLGVTVFAVAAMLAWQVEDIRTMRVGESFDLNGYEITLASVDKETGPNYFTTKATMTIAKGGQTIASVYPEKRVYPVAGMPTTEAGIDYGVTRDVYLVIGDLQDNGSWAVRSYYKPFANWIWAGSLLMAIGGMISLADRRYRVAAGARARNSKAVPAE